MFGVRFFYGLFFVCAMLILSLLAIFHWPAVVSAQNGYLEDFDPGKGPSEVFQGHLLLGKDNNWSGRLAGGRYVLENQGDPTDIRYFYLLPKDIQLVDEGSGLSVEIEGKFSSGQYHSGAGLIFGFDPQTRFYGVFVVMEEDSFAIYRRDEGGFQMKMGGTHSAVRLGAVNRLAIVSTGQGFQFTINGQEVGSIGRNVATGNGVGLLALGTGRFAFDNFRLTAGQAAAPKLSERPSHDSYVGRFGNGRVTLDLTFSDGFYVGEARIGNRKCQLEGEYLDAGVSAPGSAPAVEGYCECDSDDYNFRARLVDANTLEFSLDDGKPFTLRRTSASRAGVARVTEARPHTTPGPAAVKPPTGFRNIEHTAGSGQVWLCENIGERSARKALLKAVDRLSGSFHERPELYAAVGDPKNREIRALFGAHFQGTVVRGMLVAARADRGFVLACLFDTPGRLAMTLQPMVQAVSRHLPALPSEQLQSTKPRQVQMHRVMLPDGSGSMMLPADWQIVFAQKGMVDASGGDGSRVSLGTWGPVLPPQMGASYAQMAGTTAGLLTAPYSDPITALQQLFPQFGQQVPQQILRVIDSAPTPWPHGGQAAFIHFDWQLGQGGQAQMFSSLALVGVMPGYGQWTFYMSIVSAPSRLFAQNLPTLLDIWKNWKVSDRVHQERIMKAADNMREINNIINQTYERRQQSQDRIAADWTEVFRDQTFLRDTELAERYEVPLTQVKDWTRALNEAAGYERYRHIPLRDLQ